MKSLLTALVLASVATTSAFAGHADPADYSTPEKTEAALIELVKGTVKTVTRDSYVYHYRNRKSGETTELTEANAAEVYTRYVLRTAYGPEPRWNDGNMLGPGLYAALDPAVSQEYASKDAWLLFEIRMAKGARYWDTQGSADIRIPEELERAVRRDFGCAANTTSDLVSNFSCWEFRKRILRKIDVVAIRYHWGRMDSPLCGGTGDSAMYFTNLAAFKKGDIRVYSDMSLPFAGRGTDRRRMLQWYSHFAAVWELWPTLGPFWPRSRESAFADTRKWASRNLLECK